MGADMDFQMAIILSKASLTWVAVILSFEFVIKSFLISVLVSSDTLPSSGMVYSAFLISAIRIDWIFKKYIEYWYFECIKKGPNHLLQWMKISVSRWCLNGTFPRM